MTGADLKRIRQELGLSALQMGQLMGYECGKPSIRQMVYAMEAKGDKPIPELREMKLNQKLNNGEGK